MVQNGKVNTFLRTVLVTTRPCFISDISKEVFETLKVSFKVLGEESKMQGL